MIKTPTILLEQKNHKNESQLLVKFEYNNSLINLMRKIPDATWSRSLKSWYVKDTEENLALILKTFKDIATVDSSKLQKKRTI